MMVASSQNDVPGGMIRCVPPQLHHRYDHHFQQHHHDDDDDDDDDITLLSLLQTMKANRTGTAAAAAAAAAEGRSNCKGNGKLVQLLHPAAAAAAITTRSAEKNTAIDLYDHHHHGDNDDRMPATRAVSRLQQQQRRRNSNNNNNKVLKIVSANDFHGCCCRYEYNERCGGGTGCDSFDCSTGETTTSTSSTDDFYKEDIARRFHESLSLSFVDDSNATSTKSAIPPLISDEFPVIEWNDDDDNENNNTYSLTAMPSNNDGLLTVNRGYDDKSKQPSEHLISIPSLQCPPSSSSNHSNNTTRVNSPSCGNRGRLVRCKSFECELVLLVG
jgi:hypothetical protein